MKRKYWVSVAGRGQMVRAESGHRAASVLRQWLHVSHAIPLSDERPKIVARSSDRLTYVYRWSDGYQAQVTSEWAIH